jgi:hypothetical protein
MKNMITPRKIVTELEDAWSKLVEVQEILEAYTVVYEGNSDTFTLSQSIGVFADKVQDLIDEVVIPVEVIKDMENDTKCINCGKPFNSLYPEGFDPECCSTECSIDIFDSACL